MPSGLCSAALLRGAGSGTSSLRLSNDSAQELYAPFYVLLLAVGVCVIAVALTFVSWILLVRCGIWASPIPMAVGMLLESFVSGSVAQGIEVAKAAAPKSETPQSEQKNLKKFYGGDEIGAAPRNALGDLDLGGRDCISNRSVWIDPG